MIRTIQKKIIAWILLIIFSQNIFGQTPVKNLILMIPDGTSIPVISLARWYKGSALAIDPYLCGLVKTHSSDAIIGDSAPTGSTYATGKRSRAKFVATYPNPTPNDIDKVDSSKAYQPLMTWMEAARLNGKSIGVAVTCYFPHATPADFTAHTPERDNYALIAKQMTHNGLNVVFGGGQDYLLPEDSLYLVSNGTSIISSLEEFQQLSSADTKVWGLFAPADLPYAGEGNAHVPTLAEMTAKAIDILSASPHGFVLMVEGSKVDWAAHNNDTKSAVTDFLAFDEAVKVAMGFAENDGKTLVAVCPDHGNGGISIGNARSNGGNLRYDRLPKDSILIPLQKIPITPVLVNQIDLSVDKQTAFQAYIKELEYYLPYPITDDEKDYLWQNFQPYHDFFAHIESAQKSLPDFLTAKYTKTDHIIRATNDLINSRIFIGWTTHGHTGEDVFWANFDPRGKGLSGLIENTQVFDYLSKAIEINNIDSLTAAYYHKIPLSELRRKKQFNMSLTKDLQPDVLSFLDGKDRYEFHLNTNFYYVNKKKKQLSTLIIYNSQSDALYLPKNTLKNL